MRARHPLPRGAAAIVLRGLGTDVALTLLVAAALALPVLALALWAPRAARSVHRVALVAVTLAGVVLVQYFAVTLVPLGADLFGYSWSNIRETVSNSRGAGLGDFAALGLAAGVSWLFGNLALRAPLPRAAAPVFLAVSVIATMLPRGLELRTSSFASDTEIALAANPILHLIRATATEVADRRADRAGPPLGEYPFRRPVLYEDVLGPHFRPSLRPPDLVFVIVEGLGRDFVGPHARYGGFTPFLDSLAERSLFWENFLSTSGRTFGVLPSLLGSLPFAHDGFAELGARMPYHESLITLLRSRGYHADYFTGTDGGFDRIDAFMERQGVDRFIDQGGFGPGYDKQPAGEGGASWGYGDDELFRRALAADNGTARDGTTANGTTEPPRISVYLTITTHEPFLPPHRAAWATAFDQRLATFHLTDERRAEFLANRHVFETLLYADDAIRGFLSAFARRPGYERTIFFITGDHRLIPVPPATRIDQFRVPFIVWSPLLRAPRRFPAVSSHLDVTPSVLALLHSGWGVPVPDTAAWLGVGLDTNHTFRAARSLALMRSKGQLADYLDGEWLVSRGQLFRVDSALGLREAKDSTALAVASHRLLAFRRLDRFVADGGALLPATPQARADAIATAREDSAVRAAGLASANPAEALAAARLVATRGSYEGPRLIARRLLRDAPQFHDARAFLGRTYGWERRFDEARTIIDDLTRRAPDYRDGLITAVDIEVWAGRGADALRKADAALARFPKDPDLLFGRARALETLGRRREALAVLDTVQAARPGDPLALELRRRLR